MIFYKVLADGSYGGSVDLDQDIAPIDYTSIAAHKGEPVGMFFYKNNWVYEIPAPPVWEWFIDVGPFFDRFGSIKMAILTSTDAGVKAILQDLQVRHWVDLKRPDVAQGLAYVGSVVPALTQELQTAILTTPVSELESSVLRKLYFS